MRQILLVVTMFLSLSCQADNYLCPRIDDIKAAEFKRSSYVNRHTKATTYDFYNISQHEWVIEIDAYGKYDLAEMQKFSQDVDIHGNIYASYINSAKVGCHYVSSKNPMIFLDAYHYFNTH